MLGFHWQDRPYLSQESWLCQYDGNTHKACKDTFFMCQFLYQLRSLAKKERATVACHEGICCFCVLSLAWDKEKFRGPTINQATDLSDSASECCTLLMTGRPLSLYVIFNRHTAGMSNVEIPAWLNRKRKLLNFKLVTEVKKDSRSSFAIQFKYLSLFHLCILFFFAGTK